MLKRADKAAELVDLSHTIEHGLVTLEGYPAPVICDYLTREESRARYSEGTEFHIGKIEMIANTGTYIDSPFHRYAGGKDLSELPLEGLANLDAVVVKADVARGRAIDSSYFQDIDIGRKAVLIQTGWDKNWGTPRYFNGHPFLTKDAAEYLVQSRAALVGIDSLNIDDTGDPARPVHSILLGAEILIAEHLCNLDSLPAREFKFFAVPVKVKAFGTFPVRAFALIDRD